MANIRFEIDWCDPSTVEVPADASLGELSIWIDDDCITRNLSLGTRHRRAMYDGVFGNLAGIAEWLIDNWLFLNHEIHCPFPKSAFESSDREHSLPGLIDAEAGWQGLAEAEISTSALADWQHRHTLGHATSDLALPSIVMVPEVDAVVVAVDAPAKGLSPTVNFVGPDRRPRRPSMHLFTKADLLTELVSFINCVLHRLALNATSSPYAAWLGNDWVRAQTDSADLTISGEIRYGSLVSQRLNRLAVSDPALAGLVEDSLIDCPMIGSESAFETIAAEIDSVRLHRNGARPADIARWRADIAGRDYQQGYRLAQIARRNQNLGVRPIADLMPLLNQNGLSFDHQLETTLFRCLAVPRADSTRGIIVSSQDPRARTPNGLRFALAATFGRVAWEHATAADRQHAQAHGDYARISQSRRANAFAAELLLPSEVLHLRLGSRATHGQIQDIAEEYGIASSAALWHARNHGLTITPIRARQSI